jgi:nuclear transcription Y subunit beta
VANINRIMKKVLPPNAKVSKEAKEAIQECVSEFISFVTQEASDKVLQEKRKTVTGDDVLWAMSTLGFEHYIEPLKIYLQKYRDSVKTDGKGGGTGSTSKRSKTVEDDDDDDDDEDEDDDE